MKAIVIKAFADKDGDTWQCQAESGLFAFGESFRNARKQLAEIVLEQAKAEGTDIDAVRIFCVTRKTFKVDAGAIQ